MSKATKKYAKSTTVNASKVSALKAAKDRRQRRLSRSQAAEARIQLDSQVQVIYDVNRKTVTEGVALMPENSVHMLTSVMEGL